MNNLFENILLGFNVAFSFANIIYCFIGVFIGTLVGVLPGIGPVGTIALLLPVTFGISPVSAIIMLAGIYYGAQYGGSTTSILINIPGEATSVVTCLDGYQMAQQGRAGPALGIAAFGSFIAGTIGLVILTFLAKPLSELAIEFGPPEYFSLMVLALVILSCLSSGSMLKSLIMTVIGFWLSQLGMDIITGHTRFTFGISYLEEGIGLVPIVMGLFGIAEVFKNLEQKQKCEFFKGIIKNLLPNYEDWRNSIGAILRGSFLGFFLGVLPGGGAIIASFLSYGLEKRISKYPEKFGTGVIEGVAGPESANNAGSTGAFVPLFSLGIPSNAITAMLLGALIIHGVKPGPQLIKQNPEIFWGTVMSMYLGNIMLLILNLPVIGLWVKLLKVPYRILFPFILFFGVIGSYSVNNSIFDVFIMFIFGLIGYLFKKYDYEAAPLVMAYILGPLLENALRQSLLISGGSGVIFFKSLYSTLALSIAIFLLLYPVISGKIKEFFRLWGRIIL